MDENILRVENIDKVGGALAQRTICDSINALAANDETPSIGAHTQRYASAFGKDKL